MTSTLVLRGPRERRHSNVFNSTYPEADTRMTNNPFTAGEVASRLSDLRRICCEIDTSGRGSNASEVGPRPMSIDATVRIRDVRVLGEGHHALRRFTVEHQRSDGSWQIVRRETCTRGESAVCLLYSNRRGTVILTRQFRLPMFLERHQAGLLMEPAGGLLSSQPPATVIRREVEEETGYEIGEVEPAFVAYMSPALATERVHFFCACVDSCVRRTQGGGLTLEGEDIEVVEIPLNRALEMVAEGEIVDAKTILLLQHREITQLRHRGVEND